MLVASCARAHAQGQGRGGRDLGPRLPLRSTTSSASPTSSACAPTCTCRATPAGASRDAPSSPATASAASTAAAAAHLTVDHVVPRSKGGGDELGQRRHLVRALQPARRATACRTSPTWSRRASRARPSPSTRSTRRPTTSTRPGVRTSRGRPPAPERPALPHAASGCSAPSAAVSRRRPPGPLSRPGWYTPRT